jgi:hypothetical protein
VVLKLTMTDSSESENAPMQLGLLLILISQQHRYSDVTTFHAAILWSHP